MIRHPYALFVLSFSALIGCRPAPSKGDVVDAGPAAPAQRYGDAMSELGRRFELVGRAAAAGRFELVRYQLGEIDEIFDDDLPHAAPPKVGSNVNLAGVAQAFAETNLPELDRAAAAHDRAAFAAAFNRASAVCNGCHQATGHAFIEIPGELGASVPKLDPLPRAQDAGPM